MQMSIPQRIGVERPTGIDIRKEPLFSGISTCFLPPQQQSQNVGIKRNLALRIRRFSGFDVQFGACFGALPLLP
jgi:hypothetical protein